MFIRRIYYLNADGTVLYIYSMQGDFEYTDSETEKSLFFPDMNPDEIGCLEWTEKDEELEAKFMGHIISVDVTTEPHEVVFTEPPEPEPEPEYATFDDYERAFEELGV